jgi:hypothetical protein
VTGASPTGTVTFTDTYQDATITLGIVILATNFQASLTPTFTLGGGVHSISAIYSGDGNNPHNTATLTQTVVGISAPIVSTVTENAGSILNSGQISLLTQLEVTFSEPESLQSGAFNLTRVLLPNDQLGDGAVILPAVSLDSTGTVATLTFGSNATATGADPIDNGSLADGNWTLTVTAADVSSSGVPMVANETTTNIRRLFGLVVPGGSIVDATDFTQFANTYGLSQSQPGYNAAFDFTNTGTSGNTIDSTDFIQFSNRFGESI